jgi:putative hydrolase of HD superfamily
MTPQPSGATVDSERTADAVIDLGRLALAFGRVDRRTYHPDGRTPESDTDHTVMLGLIACAVAAQHGPGLDVGLVAQYALVHDLVEVYAGDTPTLRALTPQQAEQKQQREHAAYERITAEFAATLPWLPDLIGEYEARTTPEARLVWAMDKLMPKVASLLNGGVTIAQAGMSPDELAERYTTQAAQVQQHAGDFPDLLQLRDVLIGRVLTAVHQRGVTR